MTVKNYLHTVLALIGGILITGCGAGGNDQGLEYAPNMYHSVPYEPLTQITDKGDGTATEFLRSNDDGHGEYYNSNPLNPHSMTMRVPPANTVPRTKYLPYWIPKDSLALAASVMENPLPDNEAILDDGQVLYERFCDHCHGAKGLGAAEGSVGEVFAGVPSYTSAAVKNVSGGHIFHVITHGKGRMGAHGSQISVEDRWKIVRYVQTLQNQ
ncbi:MAG: cytochrome c [Cyclobacteriaceae bacterium]